MEEKSNRINMTKMGFFWYSLLSFLLVTFMIYLAVVLTYNAATRDVGSALSERIAVLSDGGKPEDYKNVKTIKTMEKGEQAFRVSYEKNGEKHTVIVDKRGNVKRAKDTDRNITKTLPDGKDGFDNMMPKMGN